MVKFVSDKFTSKTKKYLTQLNIFVNRKNVTKSIFWFQFFFSVAIVETLFIIKIKLV